MSGPSAQHKIAHQLQALAHRTSPQTVGVALDIGRMRAFPATGTHLATNRMDNGKAIGTDRQPGNVQEGLGANAAVGWEQNGEETFGKSAGPGSATLDSSQAGRSLPQNNRRPQSSDVGLTSPD